MKMHGASPWKLMLFGLAFAATPTPGFAKPAKFVGEVVARWGSDGRSMTLEKPFEFIDSAGTHWPVPAGTYVDGASIPGALWSFIGGPFEGKYRNASVIHDFYCDVHLRKWARVHRMFYDAMIASGVGERQAKMMYLAVLWGGPRWTDQSIKNTVVNMRTAKNLAKTTLDERVKWIKDHPDLAFEDYHDTGRIPEPLGDNDVVVTGSVFRPRYAPPDSFDLNRFSNVASRVRSQNLSVAEIERIANQERGNEK